MLLRTSDTIQVLPHSPTMTLPDGRTLEQGQEFSVTGEGRFRFYHEFMPDGSVTAWGPVAGNFAEWRSFRPEQVRTIHRSVTPRGGQDGKAVESGRPASASPDGDDEG